jgi:hypothetical protein
MHEFVEAFKFILHDGAIAGEPQLPSLAHLALRTLEVGAIGVAISALIAVPVGVWLGHVHRGSFLAINLGNVGRALPSLAVLARPATTSTACSAPPSAWPRSRSPSKARSRSPSTRSHRAACAWVDRRSPTPPAARSPHTAILSP